MKFLPVTEFENRQKSIDSQTRMIMSSAMTKIGFLSCTFYDMNFIHNARASSIGDAVTCEIN